MAETLQEWDHAGHDDLQAMLERWGITMQRPKEGLFITDIQISATAKDMTEVCVTYQVHKTRKQQTVPGIPDRPVRTRLRSPEAVYVVGEDDPVMYTDTDDD